MAMEFKGIQIYDTTGRKYCPLFTIYCMNYYIVFGWSGIKRRNDNLGSLRKCNS